MSRAGSLACGLALACGIAGCKQAPQLPSVISPYRIDIQQGNVLTQEMLSKLKAGMTRAQVRFVLGSPLIVDPFRTDRWDYVSTFEKQGKEVERRRVTVIFVDDKLVRIEGDVTLSDSSLTVEKPAEKPPLVENASAKPAAPAEAVKPAPIAKPAVVSPPAAKPEASITPPASAETAAPVAIDASKEPASKADPAKTDASGAAATTADPVKAASTPGAPEEKKADAAKKDAPKDKPKQPGFFSRMLDKLGI